MGRFLKMMLIFGVGFLALCYGLDYLISQGLRNTDIRKYAVWNDIFAAAIDADVVILGSSETWCGYNPTIIDSLLHCNSYNLAIDGHGFKYQLLRYNTYRRFCSKPSLIIVNLDYPGTFDSNCGYGYEREQFFPYIQDDSLITCVASDKSISLPDRVLPLYRYFGYRTDIEDGISSILGKTTFIDGGLRKGFRGNNYQWSPESLISDKVFHATVDQDVVLALDDFVRSQVKDGISVVLVEYPEYYRLRGKFDNVIEVESIFEMISDKNGVSLINCSEWPICQDSTWYYNSSHLNAKGADLFTRMLCDTLVYRGLSMINEGRSLAFLSN